MVQCPICNSEKIAESVERINSYSINHCKNCDIVFSDPMKSPGFEWYEHSFKESAINSVYARMLWRHQQFLDDDFFYGKELLDIGCATGAFLNEARKKGYEAWGFDFNGEAVRISKEQYGLKNTYHMDIEAFCRNFSHKRFDAISCFDVLEHLDDPNQFISRIKSILKPGGYVALSIPNRGRAIETIDYDFPPGHLTKWSKDSLSNFLEINGFKIVKCVVRRLGISELVKYLDRKIKFGIVKKIGKSYIKSGDHSLIKRANILINIKNLALRILVFPLMPVLLFLSLDGTSIYTVAQRKD